ncbi:uncharacterized protein LOC122363578 [Amphibalanus amphitrite]|uniref:uncharacterized protein LOC122363578 n=1 Tax=Amphibalanus amphitrite TaxID=1232801 RepID=UPI001C911163|nr:uncharacterized protein LOC122363578 [Amphibalanus amphitrite]
MREHRTTTMSSTGYTGFRTVECFQVPYTWKRAGQCIAALLLVCGAAVLACGIRLVYLHYGDCSATCSTELYIGVAAVAAGTLDIALHLLLLGSLRGSWPAGAITVTVWDALKAAAAIYLLVSATYALHTRPETVVFEHYVAEVALVACMTVAVYGLASAAHEQRAANIVDGSDF